MVSQICSALEKGGIRCWMAPRDIQPGRVYSGAITEAIGEARVALLIVTPYLNDSMYVVSELAQAMKMNLPIVPLRVEQVKLSSEISFYVDAFQWLDVAGMAIDEFLPCLQQTIRRLLVTQKPCKAAIVDSPKPSEPPARTSLHSFKNSLGNTLVQLPAERLASGAESETPFYVCTTCVSNRDYHEFVRAGGPPPVAHRAHPQMRTWQGADYPDSMGDHPYTTTCRLAVGGGWASSCDWLKQEWQQKTYGAIWCPGGWPMKDGGFRICLARTQGWAERLRSYLSPK